MWSASSLLEPARQGDRVGHDENSQIQALDRTQASLPMKKGIQPSRDWSRSSSRYTEASLLCHSVDTNRRRSGVPISATRPTPFSR